MKCPVCGAAELMHDIRDMEHTYKGQSTVFPQVEADYCAVCGEGVLAPAEADRVLKLMNDVAR